MSDNQPHQSHDVFPEFAISLEEASARIKKFQEYVRENMTEGEDYGVIPGTTKPTLFKPGAEKLNGVFGFAPRIDVTGRTEDWDKNFVAYDVKCTLINKRTGQMEAEGVGSCNSRERRYARQDAAGIANTVLKMAKKRALIDATLSATRASGLFAQDLEDQDDASPAAEPRASRRDAAANQPASQPRTSGDGLTDAQHRAVIACATRVFGHAPSLQELQQAGLGVERPIAEMTKAQASGLIDRLKFRMAEMQQRGATPQQRTQQAPRPTGISPETNRAAQRSGRARNVEHEAYARGR